MRLDWDTILPHSYEAGLDQGVFYPQDGNGVPWNGLTALTEGVSDDAQTVIYIDGQRLQNQLALGTFSGTLEAVTYPDEFLPYDGYAEPMFSGQKRPLFGLSYRTFIGDVGYKLHLVYNCLVKPSTRTNGTLTSSSDISNFSWDLSTTPVAFPYNRPTSHIFIDSTQVVPEALSQIEDILYGSDNGDPRFPDISEVLGIFEETASIIITDLGDGSFTATGPDANVESTDDPTEWIFNWPNVVLLPYSSDTYRVSSY